MSDIAAQKRTTFQHLSLLRKAIIEKRTGVLSYTATSNHCGQIAVFMGNMNTESQAIKELARFFSSSVERCDWQKKVAGNQTDWGEATLALSQAINDIQWSDAATMELKRIFFKLPPVNIRMVPFHRYQYNDGITYLMLYQQSVQSERYSLSSFLNAVDNDKILKRRLKVLVLGYCLGFITAAAKVETTHNTKNNTASIASRILRRVRGI